MTRQVSPSVFDSPASIQRTSSIHSPPFVTPFTSPKTPSAQSNSPFAPQEPLSMRPMSFEANRSIETESEKTGDSSKPPTAWTKASKDPLIDRAATRKRLSYGGESTASSAVKFAGEVGRRVRLSLISSHSRTGAGRLSSEPDRPVEKPVVQVEGAWTGRGEYIYDPNSNRRLRQYKLHPGANRFYLKGRILTSASPVPFLVSLLIAFFLPVTFLVFNGEWLVRDLKGGAAVVAFFIYLTLLMWVNMLRAAWRDPGISQSNS
jgi:hypothetical protein